jgi:hypothetical protein
LRYWRLNLCKVSSAVRPLERRSGDQRKGVGREKAQNAQKAVKDGGKRYCDAADIDPGLCKFEFDHIFSFFADRLPFTLQVFFCLTFFCHKSN